MGTYNDKNENAEYEENVGRAISVMIWLKNTIIFALIGGIAGFFIGKGWFGALIGAVAGIVIRYIFVNVIWKFIALIVSNSK